jgi:hypothetical protein
MLSLGRWDTRAIPVGTLVRPVIEKVSAGDRDGIKRWLENDGYIYVVVGYDLTGKLNTCRALATGVEHRFFAYELDTTEPNDD